MLFPNRSSLIADGPKNVAVTPEKKAYKPGTTIQVTADSVPTLSSYKWVDTTTNTPMGTENSITITANMVGRASLKVVLCNTMPIPPVYDVCCEVTLSFEVRCTCYFRFMFHSNYAICFLLGSNLIYFHNIIYIKASNVPINVFS